MRRPRYVQLTAALPLLLACAASHHLPSMTVDQVAARLAAHDGHTYVFDANEHDRYVKGHVPGARWVDEKPTTVDLPADKGATLIFYCASEL